MWWNLDQRDLMPRANTNDCLSVLWIVKWNAYVGYPFRALYRELLISLVVSADHARADHLTRIKETGQARPSCMAYRMAKEGETVFVFLRPKPCTDLREGFATSTLQITSQTHLDKLVPPHLADPHEWVAEG